MNSRKKRSEQLFKWSVISAGVLVSVLYLLILITGFEAAKAAEIAIPKAPRLSLPQKCEVYRIEYTEDQWDEVTETYPTNHEWENCMGVGRR